MIINRPTPENFEKQCIQYLVQAIDITIEKEHMFSAQCGESKENYWKYHQGVLNNSLTLIFLCLENYLKMKICELSPLMLIAEDPRKWKTSNTEKNFNRFYIHPFEGLLNIYQELGISNISENEIRELNNLKTERNNITHGLAGDNITVEYLLDTFYTVLTNLWGSDVWWKKFREYQTNEPFFGDFDRNIEESQLVRYIHFFESYLTRRKVSDLFGANFQDRKYYCPNCTDGLVTYFDENESKYTFLVPNEADSIEVYCVICAKIHNVIRENCLEEDCSGNVLLDRAKKVCLTCLEPNL